MPPAWHSATASMASCRGGIQEPDQTEQHQVLRQVRRTKSPRLDAWVLQPCEAQHALPLRCEPVRCLHEMVARDRHGLSAPGLLPIAMVEDDFRGTLDQQHLLASSVPVQRRHEFVFRFKGDDVDPGDEGLLAVDQQLDVVAARERHAGEPAHGVVYTRSRFGLGDPGVDVVTDLRLERLDLAPARVVRLHHALEPAAAEHEVGGQCDERKRHQRDRPGDRALRGPDGHDRVDRGDDAGHIEGNRDRGDRFESFLFIGALFRGVPVHDLARESCMHG